MDTPTGPSDHGRRAPTAAEARALGHPTRLRIVFACRERARTNKELAEALGTTPGTIHYHLRPLVAEGFLAAEEPRPGPRGSREQPYRATGKSWELGGDPQGTEALRQVVIEDLQATVEEDLVALMRLGLTLPEDELEQLLTEVQALADAAKERSVALQEGSDGALASVTVAFAVHRTPSRAATSDRPAGAGDEGG